MKFSSLKGIAGDVFDPLLFPKEVIDRNKFFSGEGINPIDLHF